MKSDTRTREDIEKQCRESIKVQMLGADVSFSEREGLQQALLEILPTWQGFIHQRRLDKDDPHAMRADGVMVLSNMLDTLVNNTTPDKAARQSVRRRLHRAILENLE